MLRLAGIVEESVVDGPGVRLVYFLQGCKHNCKGCQNPETHDFNGGKEYTIEQLKDVFLKQGICDGVTFSGGDPMEQADELLSFAEWLSTRGVHIVCYTGYTYEELCNYGSTAQRELLNYIDWLIDGRFVLSERTLSLKFRGSRNQRIVLPKQSKLGAVCILTE